MAFKRPGGDPGALGEKTTSLNPNDILWHEVGMFCGQRISHTVKPPQPA